MRAAASGRYTFAVDPAAGKAGLAAVVAAVFKVKVKKVKTLIVKGRSRCAGRTGKTIVSSPWKKAFVELEKGQKIDIFDVTQIEQPAAK